MARIEASSPPLYLSAMRSLLLRLLALVAVLIMPLGMAPAAAHQSHAAASMPMQHCPDQHSRSETKGALGECTMACSAALPAMDLSRDEPLTPASPPVVPAMQQVLHGLHPETATPPPRRS